MTERSHSLRLRQAASHLAITPKDRLLFDVFDGLYHFASAEESARHRPMARGSRRTLSTWFQPDAGRCGFALVLVRRAVKWGPALARQMAGRAMGIRRRGRVYAGSVNLATLRAQPTEEPPVDSQVT